jgi:zinc finger SWIM domain-containing protein 3
MEEEQYVSLEEIEEYYSVANRTFTSEEDFFEFYNNYAKHKGFSVRKDNVRYKAGTDVVKWRRFVCSCEGYREVKHFERTNKKSSHVPSLDMDAWLGLMSSGMKGVAFGL